MISLSSSLPANVINKNVNKKKYKNNENRLVKSTSINENVQIRLSNLGFMKQTPSKVDVQITNGRILSIIDKAIDQLQIAVNIKVLLQHNACRLRKCLPLAQVEYIQNICFKHLPRYPPPKEPRYSQYTQNVSTMIEKINKSDFMPPKKSAIVYQLPLEIKDILDPNIFKAMEMMCSNKNLRTTGLTEWCITQDPISIDLINSMKNLRNAMQFRLSMTALEEKDREKSLRLAFITNISVVKKLQRTKEELEDQDKSFQAKLANNQAIIDEYLNNTESTKEMYQNKVKLLVAKSETHMNKSATISEEVQVYLAETSTNTIATYETIVSQHLKYEKDLRKKRNKVITQLSSWLIKYDTDCHSRQVVLDELTEGYEAEKAIYDVLLEKFNEQNKEYVVLMVEKSANEDRIWEERAVLYLRTRSARRIQRCWRAYRERKIARRKARKAGKKDKGEKIKVAKRAPAPSKDKKGKKGKKGKKEPPQPVEVTRPDLNFTLGKKFGADLFDDLQGGGFEKKDIEVDLLA